MVMAATSDAPDRDQLGRPLRSLRVSVTDRCNLRCGYCMPEEEYTWLPRERILDYEELTSLVRAFVQVGVDRVRLTGGEPLLRKDLWRFVEQLRALEGLEEIALTTNALLLADQAQGLFDAGLDRVTVSLDTLRPERFRDHTRRDGLAATLAGMERWLTRPGRADPAPPRHKTVALVLLGLYPLVLVQDVLLSPLLADLPRPLSLLLTLLLSVTLTVGSVLPRLTRIFDGWLRGD